MQAEIVSVLGAHAHDVVVVEQVECGDTIYEHPISN